jgi:hypothetical protein
MFRQLTIAVALAVFSGIAAAQYHADAVLNQIEIDYVQWQAHLGDQYRRAALSRGDYERQLQTLEINIDRRRQARYAELEQAELRRREVQALERIANQPSPGSGPTQPMTCEFDRLAITPRMTCR